MEQLIAVYWILFRKFLCRLPIAGSRYITDRFQQ